ncbi:cache domain-containing protein [uncultured Desulfuromusa sp.]|uniref:cache domain-containing protein n=1 Tax=uncultured Desulfuromusa sp. TaxID=219183 RepID=UPI002AA5EBF6|nr:cache domain-containing protein [uncultured Desulfuromusa sp.]
MKNKISFLKSIRLWGILFLIALAGILIIIDVSRSYRDVKLQTEQVRVDYLEQQRQLIKWEVDRVVKLINFETEHVIQIEQDRIKERVYEAYAIAENLYEQHKSSKDNETIRKIIIDAIRPIRFDQGRGYYFMTGLNGVSQLMTDSPATEGKNILDFQDSRGKFVVRDLVNIATRNGEGFSRYYWRKPDQQEGDFLKYSFVKKFEPLDCFIGTGVYLDAIEDSMQKIISKYVDNHRFGPNRLGYVFILDLLNIQGGDRFAIMYANPNRPDLVGQYVSDKLPDAKGKVFRQEFLRGLREHGECYVDYWYKKFSNLKPSPKTSFFKLTEDGRFIVAAGVYLDDVEEKIVTIQTTLNDEIWSNVRLYLFAVTMIILCFVLLWNWLSQRLRNDFLLFAEFFNGAADSSAAINRKLVKFVELDQLAEYANQMLDDKDAAEKALVAEREQLLVTLYSIVDGVITTATDGRIELMNHVAESLTGWKQSDATGKPLSEVFCFKSESPLSTSEQRALLIAKDGQEYQILVGSAPLRGAEGVVRGQVIVFRDETERLKTEEELFKARKLESVGLLAGGIAHDFNNILAGLFGNIELAKRKIPEGHAAYSYLQVANQALERATNLTKQLLTFAKGGEPLLEAVSVEQVIDAVVQFNLSGSQVKAEFVFPEDLWPVNADKGQFGQIFANLTINAKHAMPMGGTLHISAENISLSADKPSRMVPGDYVKLLVRDEGIGMTAEVLDKIFDPYFSTKQTGSGLGLATVRSIVKKHKGSIFVISEPGRGTSFTLYLPAEKTDCNSVISAATQNVDSTISAGRVLVVDDEDIIQKVLVDMLILNGYSVDTADEGRTGKDKYLAARHSGQPYDLVIMDLTIPGGMGGKEAAEEILKVDPHARIIASSGYSTDPIMAKYWDYGFKGRLLKPFRLDDLTNEISRIQNQ